MAIFQILKALSGKQTGGEENYAKKRIIFKWIVGMDNH